MTTENTTDANDDTPEGQPDAVVSCSPQEILILPRDNCTGNTIIDVDGMTIPDRVLVTYGFDQNHVIGIADNLKVTEKGLVGEIHPQVEAYASGVVEESTVSDGVKRVTKFKLISIGMKFVGYN